MIEKTASRTINIHKRVKVPGLAEITAHNGRLLKSLFTTTQASVYLGDSGESKKCIVLDKAAKDNFLVLCAA